MSGVYTCLDGTVWLFVLGLPRSGAILFLTLDRAVFIMCEFSCGYLETLG